MAVCNKQSATCHSSTESKIVALEVGLRTEGFPLFIFWEEVLCVMTRKPGQGPSGYYTEPGTVPKAVMPCVPSWVRGAEQLTAEGNLVQPAAVCVAGGSKPSKAGLRHLKQQEKSTDQFAIGNNSFACNAKAVADNAQPRSFIPEGVDTV